MDGQIFQAEMIVDGVNTTSALIDQGSTAYAIINRDYAHSCDLKCIEITPRSIVGVTGIAGQISEVAHFSINLDGY